MTSTKTSMILNYFVVFFSLFLSTSVTQGTCIFKGISKRAGAEDFFVHRQNNVSNLVPLDSESDTGEA